MNIGVMGLKSSPYSWKNPIFYFFPVIGIACQFICKEPVFEVGTDDQKQYNTY